MYLTPYFIVECKNEPDNKPNNNYCNKLESILETNAAQLGIIFGRIDATSTCFQISREHYLTHKIFQVTANSPNSTFEMFEKKGRNAK